MLARNVEKVGKNIAYPIAGGGARLLSNQRLDGGVRAEQRGVQLLLGRAQLVRQMLVVGEFGEHLQQHRDVGGARIANQGRSRRGLGSAAVAHRSGRSG